MTDNILINSTEKIVFTLKDTTGTVVAGLGTAFVLQVSKNGGAFGASAGTKAEIGSGWYSYVFTATESNTLGPLAVKITHASIEQKNLTYEVVGSDWSSVPASVTVSDLKAYLGVTGAADDDLLTSLIARAEKAIEVYCGRLFTCAADTTHYFTVGEDTEGDCIWFDADLCAVTTVTSDADGTPVTLVKDTDFVTQPRNTTPWYGFKILSSTSKFWDYTSDPETGITITGRWAYSTTPPQDIIHATTRLAAFYYRQKDAQVFDTTAVPDAGVIMVPQGIPKDVQLMLQPYRRLIG